jgi:4-amino-4-deoxy-L-arabinose transferase-like glycosyltransferase
MVSRLNRFGVEGLEFVVFRRLAIWGIVGVAFGARLAWALVVESHTRNGASLDPGNYDALARFLIAFGEYVRWPGVPTAYFAPGYPFILAVVYSLFGDAILVAKLLNVVAATATCALVYDIGRNLYGRRVGLLAAAGLAIWPGDIYAVSTTYSEPVFLFAFTATLAFYVRLTRHERRRSNGWWFALGVALGLTTLIRGASLLFLAVFTADWLLRLGWTRQVWIRSALVAAGLILAIAPWVARNWIVMDAPMVLSSDGADALWNAHSPYSTGTHTFSMDRARREMFAEEDALANPEREVAMSRAQSRYALRYWVTHPLEEMRQIPRRLYNFYEHDHWAFMGLGRTVTNPRTGRQHKRLFGRRRDAKLAFVADAYFFTMLGLGVVGVIASIVGGGRDRWTLPLAAAYFQVLHGIVFHGAERFHAPLVPILAVLAAVAVAPLAVWIGSLGRDAIPADSAFGGDADQGSRPVTQ